jgi:hypothetical protein
MPIPFTNGIELSPTVDKTEADTIAVLPIIISTHGIVTTTQETHFNKVHSKWV